MKGIIRLLIKLGILAALLIALAGTNPAEAAHKRAIAAKIASLAENDPLLHASNALHGARDVIGMYPYEYRDMIFLSDMRDAEGRVSLGIFGRVFVFRNEFPLE